MQPTLHKPLEFYTRADVDEFVANSADVVSQLHGQTTRNILEIGQRLAAVKVLLGHGEFGSWVATKCSFGARTATRYMSAARTFDGKSDTVSEIRISVVHALSSPKASEAARVSVLAAVKKGTLTSAAKVKANLADLDKPIEAAPVPPAQVADRTKPKTDKQVAAARKKVAEIIIKAAGNSLETAQELTERAMLPELQAILAKIKASRAEQQAEFNARQLAFPFELPK